MFLLFAANLANTNVKQRLRLGPVGWSDMRPDKRGDQKDDK